MNKPKAFSILYSLEQEWQNDNIKSTAISDVKYCISLGWICYSQHVEKWLLEGYLSGDFRVDEQYYKAIAEIHQKLIDANVFAE